MVVDAPLGADADDTQSEIFHDASQDVSVIEGDNDEHGKELSEYTSLDLDRLRGSFTYPRLPKGRYTRVAILQPAQDYRDPLHIKLDALALEGEASLQTRFDALSYVWGSVEKTEAIICDGRTMLVTPNCAAAMRHLRKKQSPKALWIDAICINQDSLVERNHQVSLMGEIYKAAHHVFLWLGAGSADIDHAVGNLQRLCSLGHSWGKNNLVRVILFRKFKGDAGNVVALKSIMRHAWWSRMWTFQEFVLAKRPILVVGTHQIAWDDFVEAANNTFFSDDARQEMVRRKQQHMKASELVINNVMPPDQTKDIQGIETSIHLVPMWKDIMDAHKGRMIFQFGLQDLNQSSVASDFLLKARLRQAKDPRDKLYGLYHILQACHYQLPKIDYAQPIEKTFEDVTFNLISQSQSWWILTHLLQGSESSTMEIPSWVPDFSSRPQWHQHIEFFVQAPVNLSFLSTQWPQNHFYLKRLQDGGVSTSGIFLWTIKGVTSTLAPTPALDKTFEENFEESRFEILLKTSEDFLFTLANWIDLMMSTNQAGTNAPLLQNAEVAEQALKAITRAFLRSIASRGLNFGMPIEDPMLEHQFHKIISAIQPCMSPSPINPCVTCGTSSAHQSDDAIQHFIQRTTNQATWLNFIVYMLYGCAVNRSMFRTNDLDGCPGHFGFCVGQARPGDEIVLLPGASDPVVVRRRPGPNGADCYRIVGITSGIVGQTMPEDGRIVDDVGGHFCQQLCAVLHDVDVIKSYGPRSFYLL